MKTTVPQALEEMDKAKAFEDKVMILQRYNSDPLRLLIRLNFDPNLKMDLPEGAPPYKTDKNIQDGMGQTNLYTENRRFYIWLDRNVQLPKVKKEQLFIQMLEGLQWKEAEDVILAKDRKLHTKYKTLHPKVVQAAYPGLIPPDITELPKEPKAPKKAKVLSVDSSQDSLQ